MIFGHQAQTDPSPKDARTMLVVGAHPDDAVLGAGGLVALLVQRGMRVIFLTATQGELVGDPVIRKEEDGAAARILGVELISGELHDGQVALPQALTLIEAGLQRFNPATVLVHYPHDSHQDHICLSRAAVATCRQIPNLLFYEGPTSERFWPSLVADISAVWHLKQEALLAHRSQMSRTRLMEWSGSVSRFRAWPRYGGAHCEGFCLHHGDFWALLQGFSESASNGEVALAHQEEAYAYTSSENVSSLLLANAETEDTGC